jgi:hypothetical protein
MSFRGPRASRLTLNKRQVRPVLDEVATLGGAYDLSTGQIRYRLLLLKRRSGT